MSQLLVFLQFLLIALVALPTHRPVINPVNVGLSAAALIVFCLALFAMRVRTFSVMPEPRAHGELIVRGIYGWVRHPMYLALLLCALAACLAYQEAWRWALSALLLLVLVVKMRREERLLLKDYAGYVAYRARVKALLPFII